MYVSQRANLVSGTRFFLKTLLLAFLCPVAVLHADAVLAPSTPPPGATVDGCSGCLFNYVAAPISTVGQAVTSWSFYALSTNPVTPVIFNSKGVVVGVGSPVTPTGAGQQTANFATVSGSPVLAAGDTLGWFYSGKGSIAVSLSGGPGVNSESGYGGIRAGDTINTKMVYTNRTYYVSYTTGQVQLGQAVAPGAGAVSDGCSYCLFQYAPVTSQYNGDSLLSWSFYALNTSTVVPVIFGPDGQVIGYGAANTPTSTGLQTFAYTPANGSTATLATGDSLGWYATGTGSPIAFTQTPSYGASYVAYPVPALGPGDVTTTALPNRNYAVGFDVGAAGAAVTPEPSSFMLLGTGLIGIASVVKRRFA